jgi:hypothetical protein
MSTDSRATRRHALTRRQLRIMATDRRHALFDQRDETIGDAGRYWQQCEFTREALDKIDAALARLVRGYRYAVFVNRARYDANDAYRGYTVEATDRHYTTAACALRFAARLDADSDGDFTAFVTDLATGRTVEPPSRPMTEQDIPF